MQSQHGPLPMTAHAVYVHSLYVPEDCPTEKAVKFPSSQSSEAALHLFGRFEQESLQSLRSRPYHTSKSAVCCVTSNRLCQAPAARTIADVLVQVCLVMVRLTYLPIKRGSAMYHLMNMKQPSLKRSSHVTLVNCSLWCSAAVHAVTNA